MRVFASHVKRNVCLNNDFRPASMIHDGAEIKDALNKKHWPLDLRFDMRFARELLESLIEDSADAKVTGVLVRALDVGEDIQR